MVVGTCYGLWLSHWISCSIQQWTHVFLDQLFSVSWYSLPVSTLSGLWLPWPQLPSLHAQTMFLYSFFLAILSSSVLYAGFSHSSCAVASLLSWIGLLIHLLSQHRLSWWLTQSSFSRWTTAAVSVLAHHTSWQYWWGDAWPPQLKNGLKLLVVIPHGLVPPDHLCWEKNRLIALFSSCIPSLFCSHLRWQGLKTSLTVHFAVFAP